MPVLQIRGDGERPANDGLAVRPFWCVGKTKARLEILPAIHAVVKRPAVATLVGIFNLSGLHVVVRLLIVPLDPWRMRFITQTKIESEVLRYVPSVRPKA